MPTLKELLDEVEISTEDLDEGGDKGDRGDKKEIDLKDVKLDDIPEAQRPLFQQLINTVENQTDSLAKSVIIIDTLKGSLPVKTETKTETKEEGAEEKGAFGLDKDDQYAPIFGKLAAAIEGITTERTVNKEANFKNNLIGFAQKNKDIVRYVKDMDKLVDEHPSLMDDIPKLYMLAKTIGERRVKQEKDKKDDLNREQGANRFSTERSGTSNQDVGKISGDSKSITEAFEKTVEQATK